MIVVVPPVCDHLPCLIETPEQRPSHKDFAFNSCATAGCHNYHDNRALYENFLSKHSDELDMLDSQMVMLRSSSQTEAKPAAKVPTEEGAAAKDSKEKLALTLAEMDAPDSVETP